MLRFLATFALLGFFGSPARAGDPWDPKALSAPMRECPSEGQCVVVLVLGGYNIFVTVTLSANKTTSNTSVRAEFVGHKPVSPSFRCRKENTTKRGWCAAQVSMRGTAISILVRIQGKDVLNESRVIGPLKEV